MLIALVALSGVGFAGEAVRPRFAVAFDEANGGVKSVVLNDDTNRMNWIEGKTTWGVPTWFAFKGLEKTADGIVASYEHGAMKLRAERRIDPEDGSLVETYRFTNTGAGRLTYNRGDLAIPVTFNDSYGMAETCVKSRCDTHIWCGGEASWIHAVKMGPFPTELALVLTEGSLDTYSVHRSVAEWSNDRGDFFLHPDPFTLEAGESTTVAWRLVAFPEGGFRQALAAAGGVKVDLANETVFPGEDFEVTLTAPDGTVTHKTVKPDRGFGEYKLEFECAGKTARAVGYASPDIESLIAARVKFIVDRQQENDPASQYDGAFLIYDNETKGRYVSYVAGDHNGARERIGMGLLVARWCRNHPEDARAVQALARWESYLIREIWDAKTGWVWDDVGHSQVRMRLYNLPWVVDYWLERWETTGDRAYLDKMALTIKSYYTNGGVKHYPNAAFLADAVKALADAKHPDANDCRASFDAHVKAILARGLLYPPHEVNFEQTIASPAAHLTASWCECFGKDPEVMAGAKFQNAALARFNGDQPHHRQGDVPIRHWDGFWFGKNLCYGDVFPHYWSALTGNAFWRWSNVSGDREMRRRAARNLRNTSCVARPDGSASCAYLFPYSITMTDAKGEDMGPLRRGEYEDPWANDQDFGLYVIYRAYSIDPALFKNGAPLQGKGTNR